MTSIPRAPFYVPKPQDEAVWYGAPRPRNGSFLLASAELKWYGAPGQVPTKCWSLQQHWDEAAVWKPWPVDSPILQYLTQQKMFGQGGQVNDIQRHFDWDDAAPYQIPSRGSNRNLTTAPSPFVPRFWKNNVDDAAEWNGPVTEWKNSLALQILTSTTFYGKGGQVPTRQWHYDFDDAAAWSGSPQIIPQSLEKTLAALNPFIPFLWKFGQDDAAAWTGSPLSSDALHPLLSVQVTAKNWAGYTFDDAAAWSGSPLSSDALHPLLTAAGQPPTKRWSAGYTLDDPSFWQGNPLNDSRALLNTLTPPNPVIARNWVAPYTWDDAAVWSGSPLTAKSVTLTTTQVKFYGQPGQSPTRQWHYDNDDAAPWSGNPFVSPRVLLNLIVNFTPVANAKAWVFGLDDAAVWSGGPLPSVALHPLLTAAGIVRSRQWTWGLDDAAAWSGQPLSSRTLVPILTAARQVQSRQWTWGLDDASVWSGSPQISYILRPLLTAAGKVNGRMFGWDFYINEDERVWQLRYQQNARIIPPPTTFKNFFFGYGGLYTFDLPPDTPSQQGGVSVPSVLIALLRLFLPSPRVRSVGALGTIARVFGQVTGRVSAQSSAAKVSGQTTGVVPGKNDTGVLPPGT